MTEYPPISVIMPIYNEFQFIEKSLGALQAQDYLGTIEILCCDGMSTDGTRDLINDIASSDSRIKLIDNPKRIIPAALNTGIAAAQYDIIARMDGHALAAPDYLHRCYQTMIDTDAVCVGGTWEYSCDSFLQCAIAAAMDSRFAVGTASWRGDTPGDADTVPYGFFKKPLLEQLGGFNERILVNEDYELMVRIAQAGERIYYSPEIKSQYFPRRSLLKLVKQYFRYGMWKTRTVVLHPSATKPRHLVAPLFVAGLLGGLPLALTSPIVFVLYGLALTSYAILSVVFALIQASRWGWRYLPLIPLVFLLLHLTWGSGFWVGLVRWGLFDRPSRSVT